MKVQCPGCSTGYNIDISKIPVVPEGGITVTCPKCKGKIPITLNAAPAKAPADETVQNQIIPCPECGHVNIGSKTCVNCGKIFTKEELSKLTISIGS